MGEKTNKKESAYEALIQAKIKRAQKSGFTVSEGDMSPQLFDFQKYCVRIALEAGRFAVFSGTGTGKTMIQSEWARLVNKHTGKPVLILAPLAVAAQTIEEAKRRLKLDIGKGESATIRIENYEQLHNIDVSRYAGIVLEESSILKSYTGKTKRALIEAFANTPYRLCCTATPAPNDIDEIGNHSEFLGILDAPDVRSRWFVREQEGINNYRLKGHAHTDFYGWVASWAIMFENPSEIGFVETGKKFRLPKLNLIHEEIKTDSKGIDLFNLESVNATEFQAELRRTMTQRLERVASIANSSDEPFIIWIKQDAEGDMLRKLIPDAVEVRGSEKPEEKERKLIGFAHGEFRVIVTKGKIAQYGLNWQHCRNQIHASLDFSFEALYQEIRRSWRFGQKQEVNAYIISVDTMGNIAKAIEKKERKFEEMKKHMEKAIQQASKYQLQSDYEFQEDKGQDYWIMRGDSVKEIKRIGGNSIDMAIFSPPFSSLFTYSDNVRDMGNCDSHEEFFEQYAFLLNEIYRIMRPGRIVAVHTKDLAIYKNSSGYTGLYDFTGDHHRAMERAGFKYHSKITIWTDPVLERARTNTQRLLYHQVQSDSSYSGVGCAEYVTLFRKWEGVEEEWKPINNKTKERFPLDTWQKWASPVWMDIRRTDVLNGKEGVDTGDEKHIAPLQLGVIERCVYMWSNPGETIFTPFAGIGSELYQSILCGRKAIGIELKESYYKTAIKNIKKAMLAASQQELFL